MNPLLIGPIFQALGAIFDRILPDPEKKAAAQMELLKMQQNGEFKQLESDLQLALAQSATNTAEAASGSAYAAGWRPTIGYICAAGLAYQYLARPLLVGLGHFDALPALDGSLFELIFGMLGLAGMRTYEKIKKAT